MSIVKKARGFQRFMLDCGFWRSLKWSGATLAEIGLQTAAVSYCYEHTTDGVLPGPDIADLAFALGVRERDAEKVVPTMLKRRVWRKKRGSFEIVGFLDHNPSSAEIDDYRARKASAGAKGNHDRWHKDRFDPTCDFCVSDDAPGAESHLRSHPDGTADSPKSRARRAESTTPLPPAKRGVKGSPRANGTNPRAVADKAEAERRQRARETIESCTACDGRGVIERGDGTVVQCDHRGAA